MTLEEISQSLPNGFHDAEVRRIVLDYSKRTMEMEADVWVGTMKSPPETREAYRLARLTVSGLLFCAIDQPGVAARVDDVPTVDDIETMKAAPDPTGYCAWSTPEAITLRPELRSSMPAGTFLHTFYVFDWYSYIHVAAENAELEWLTPVSYRE